MLARSSRSTRTRSVAGTSGNLQLRPMSAASMASCTRARYMAVVLSESMIGNKTATRRSAEPFWLTPCTRTQACPTCPGTAA